MFDSASCILVSVTKKVSIMSRVDYETQLFTLVYYVINLICIKLKFVIKSLYDFASHVMI